MFIREEFPDDNFKSVMRIQTTIYYDVIRAILKYCEKRYIDSCELLQYNNNLYNELIERNSFYETTFEPIIEFFAAYFRFIIYAKQPSLFEDSIDSEEKITNIWNEYIENESRRLADNNDFCRSILTAYCNQKNYRAIDYSHDKFHPEIYDIIEIMKNIYYKFPKSKYRFGL